MQILRNLQLTGAAARPFLLDVYYVPSSQPKPIVLFAHGFKGFKDWGHWDLIARRFAEAGFVFIKFNFSHNGTTLAAPTDFADLEAFGQNNYSKELNDLQAVLTWLHHGDERLPAKEADLGRIHLIGHSRGGAISIIYASQDERISSLLTWASVASLDYAWKTPHMIAQWEADGQYEVVNGRTGQQMPIYFQMYRDYKAKREILNVEQALQRLNIPMLIVHGTEDPAVPATAAETLQRQKPDAKLHLIADADHVFGGRHPFEQETLPTHSQELADQSIQFLKSL
ncbi:MAG: alpha/beta fold hydrolase [Phaeodactylibacter sp.]|uniref:alpha/beta hydrolase family protein n=1 Tax=Phaeodactylibacter sp. TaxID=1940289 RepID=UPI0032EC4D7D